MIKSITALKVGDFDGLTSLTELRLNGNQLTTLPEDIFDGLNALTTLYLYGNQFTTLPEDIFDGAVVTDNASTRSQPIHYAAGGSSLKD